MFYLGWFDDNSKKSMEQKIAEAVARYRQKYGQAPNVCLVHPDDYIEHQDGVVMRRAGHVHRHHLLVGREILVAAQDTAPAPSGAQEEEL